MRGFRKPPHWSKGLGDELPAEGEERFGLFIFERLCLVALFDSDKIVSAMTRALE